MKVRKQVLGMALGVTAMVAAATAVSAQDVATLPKLWEITSASVPWFPTTPTDTLRGMAFNPATGNLLALSRQGGTNIQVIDGATGAVGTPMNVTGLTGAGGTFAVNKIAAVNRGAGDYSIYVCNLASSSETAAGSLHPTAAGTNPSFGLYRYTGSSVPENDISVGGGTLIYRNNASGIKSFAPIGPDLPIPPTDTNSNAINDAYRLGDALKAYYDAGSNTTTVVVAYRQVTPATKLSNEILLFTIDEATGIVTNITKPVLTGATGNSFFGTVMTAVDTIYHATNGQFARYVDNNADPAVFETQSVISNLGNASIIQPNIFPVYGRPWIAYMRGGESTSFSNFRIGRLAPGVAVDNAFGARVAERVGGVVANGNGSGDFYFDPASGRLYGLIGNNQIAAVQFANPGETATKLWDGGGDGVSWTDPANWEFDTLPAPSQDVVLNNDLLAGSYTVNLPSGTSPVFAHTVSVGYVGNLNTIELVIPTSNTASVALHILSNPAPGVADILIEEGGYVRNSSTAGTGDVVWNRNAGASVVVNDEGTYEHNTARSFATPFPATGNGAISFTQDGTMVFNVAGGGAFAFSGRTYGNLTFSGFGGSYSASGTSAAVVQGVTTVDNGVSMSVAGHTGPQTYNDDLVNNGTMTLGGPVAVGATLAGGNLVNTAGNSITFANGFVIPAGDEFSFHGDGTVITAGTGEVDGDLSFNPTGGTHVLSGTININPTGSLALTAGVVDTSAGTMRAEIGSTVTQVAGWASPDFTHEVAAAATGAVAFPIGNATLSLPGTITFPSNGPDVQVDITLSTNDGDHPTVSPAGQPTALNRWWNITTNPVLTNGSFGANLDFTIDPATDLLPAINPANLKLAREITPGSGDFISYPSGYAAPVLSTTVPIVGFSDWTAFEDVVLAADVTSFTATQVGASVLVSWETAAELDNAGFAIYRANADGSRGEKLSGLIPAEGSAEAGASYSFVDAAPFAAGESSRSYLLVDIDLSGAETTHGPATATISTGSPSSVPTWTLY